MGRHVNIDAVYVILKKSLFYFTKMYSARHISHAASFRTPVFLPFNKRSLSATKVLFHFSARRHAHGRIIYIAAQLLFTI